MRLSVGVFVCAVVCFFVFAVLFTSPQDTQAVDSSWIDYPEIKFTQVKEYAGTSETPATKFGSNTDCFKRVVMLKPAQPRALLPDVPAVTGEDCMAATTYGDVGGSYFVKPGVGVAGKLTLRSNRDFLIAGNNTSTGIIGDPSAPIGLYLGLALNASSQIEADVQPDKTVTYSLKNISDVINLKNTKNERLSALYETIGFSSNGQWMVFVSPYYGLVRLNTTDGSITAFGQPTDSYSVNLSYKTAISADGRYAILSTANMLDIYDLDTCVSQTGSLSYLQKCKSRSLEDQRVADTKFGTGVSIIRFETGGSFTYYTDKLVNGSVVTRQYRVTMGDVPQFGFQYLGMGDSFASGEGAFRYKPITSTGANKCHLSLESYPYLISMALSKEKYESIACSGAITGDIMNDFPEIYDGQIKDGIGEKFRDVPLMESQFIPGVLRQNTYLRDLNPEAVTISIGGNDLGFAEKIKQCIIGAAPDTTCFNTVEDRKEVAEEVYDLVETLIPTYQKLKENGRRVYVVGYSKIVKPDGNCANNVKLDAAELAFADKLTVLIDDAIKFAAGQAGVVYVDTEYILDGHRLCETDSDHTFVHGLTEDYTNEDIQIAQESFHPKLDAQKLYRDAILQQTNNLTKPMPMPDTPSFFPRLAPTDDFFRELGSSGRQIYQPMYKDFVDTRVNTGDIIPIDLNGEDYGLSPSTSLSAELHSTPVNLGTLTTDENGNIIGELQIPQNIDPGYHSLHLYGTNLAGQKIDIYDYLLIGATRGDFDGDGILDKNEGCVFSEPIGVDSDKDGIDDACDAVEDLLPDESNNSNPELPVEPPEIVPVPVVNTPASAGDKKQAAKSLNKQDPITVPAANTISSTVAPSVAVAQSTETVEPEQIPKVLAAQDSNLTQPIFDKNPSSSGALGTAKNQTNYSVFIIAGVSVTLLTIGTIIFGRKN